MLDLIVHALSMVLVPLFLVGMAGSTIVVAITFVDDVHEFFSKDEEQGSTQETL